MSRQPDAERGVEAFYDSKGWAANESGDTVDAQLWEDLRDCAREYVSACRRKVLSHLPRHGERMLDAASGPIQYPEYLEFSEGFAKRVCVDISERALEQAQQRLGDRGEYVRASLLDLPFPDNHFDAVVSLHTIYHIEKEQQEDAVRELIRVAKPGANVVVVYANPDRLTARVAKLLRPFRRLDPDASPIYYFAHPLSWWRRFEDRCEVKIVPWRMLTAQDARRIIPDNAIGKALLKAVFRFETGAARLATRIGAYPMVVLTKK